MRIPLSILDLAPIARGETAASSIAASVALARRAEESGYRRVWYAEHHNMASIASSATSVLIAHVGAHTSSIRLGAGGVMLPNHSPLTVAEQFGTLEAMYPDRIDLGLGRAPGSDQNTMYALRRDPASADRFPDDVLELQGYLTGRTRVPGVDAVPGKGSDVPLYILGSSMFGATLAAALGLPYAFASHFAPQLLERAVAHYRAEFRPSEQLAQPYVIAGVNAIVADTTDAAREQLQAARRARVTSRSASAATGSAASSTRRSTTKSCQGRPVVVARMTTIAADRRPRKSPPASSPACRADSSRCGRGPADASNRSTIASHTAGEDAMFATPTHVSPIRWPAASTQAFPV
jgi:luciferase family oxidoreductase group 1